MSHAHAHAADEAVAGASDLADALAAVEEGGGPAPTEEERHRLTGKLRVDHAARVELAAAERGKGPPSEEPSLLQRLSSLGGSLKDMLAGAPAADDEAAPAPAPQEPGDLEC